MSSDCPDCDDGRWLRCIDATRGDEPVYLLFHVGCGRPCDGNGRGLHPVLGRSDVLNWIDEVNKPVAGHADSRQHEAV